MWKIRHIDNKKGYGLFAMQDICPGTTIHEEEPFISCQFSWNKLYKYRACDYCMKPLETAEEVCRRLLNNDSIVLPHQECCSVIPNDHVACPNCLVQYCSMECLEKSFSEYHQILCSASGAYDPKGLEEIDEIWRNLHYPPETTTIMLIVRILARFKQGVDKDELQNIVGQFCHRSKSTCGDLSHKLLGEQFEERLNILREQLTALMCDENVQHWFTVEGFHSLFALLGSNQQGIGTSSLSIWVKNCDELNLPDDQRNELDEMIDKLYEDLENAAGMFLNCEGSGLYVTQSKCNHSCSPNAEVCFLHNNHRLTLRAIKEIKKDDEITISYLNECELSRSRHSRQRHLRENYLFNCECEKCLEQVDDPDETSDDDQE